MNYYRVESRKSDNFPAAKCGLNSDLLAAIQQMASENPVVVFSKSTCCMCLVVKRLFCAMGVHTRVYELDEDPAGDAMEQALMWLQLGGATVPVVFVGGKLVGSVDRVLAAHINGSLVPLLKEAGALRR